MAYDADAYLQQLKSLLPRGRAWNHSDPVLSQLLAGMAVELARVDDRIDDLIEERDTRTAVELLAEHEEDYGLTAGILTTAERQAALTTKLRATGSLMKSYYVGLAATLSYTITIDEYRPAWAGIWQAGQPCGDQNNLFYWTVNIAFTVAEAPAFVTYADLIALLEQIKPAHTHILYQIYGPEYSYAFSTAFAAMPSLNQSMAAFGTAFSSAFDFVPAGGLDGAFSVEFSSAFRVSYGGAFDGSAFSLSFNKVYDAFNLSS